MEPPEGSKHAVAGAPVSWLEWLLGRVRAVPGPSWAVYLAIFAALAVLGHAASWLGGATEPWVLDPLVLVQASFAPFSLAWVQAINGLALRSLATLRPAMPVGEAEVAGVAADLVRTPRGWALVAGIGDLSVRSCTQVHPQRTMRVTLRHGKLGLPTHVRRDGAAHQTTPGMRARGRSRCRSSNTLPSHRFPA